MATNPNIPNSFVYFQCITRCMRLETKRKAALIRLVWSWLISMLPFFGISFSSDAMTLTARFSKNWLISIYILFPKIIRQSNGLDSNKVQAHYSLLTMEFGVFWGAVGNLRAHTHTSATTITTTLPTTTTIEKLHLAHQFRLDFIIHAQIPFRPGDTDIFWSFVLATNLSGISNTLRDVRNGPSSNLYRLSIIKFITVYDTA